MRTKNSIFSVFTLFFSRFVGEENAQKSGFGRSDFFYSLNFYYMKRAFFLLPLMVACSHSEPVQVENIDRHFKLTCITEQPSITTQNDVPSIWLLELDSSEYIICSETYANSIVKHK